MLPGVLFQGGHFFTPTLNTYTQTNTQTDLDGIFEGAKVVPVGELDDRQLVLPF